ncbi:MAG: desampylase [Halobacteriota archaeon]
MTSFDADVIDRLVEHARQGRPHEICGVLAGDRESDHVSHSVEVENVSETPRTNYLMEPEDQLRAIDEVEEELGLDVVGFYHSHPEGPEQPSETDEARATWPDHVYVIVSLGPDEPFVGAWRWTGDEFEETEVDVVG